MKSVWKDNQRVRGQISARQDERGECVDGARNGRKRENRGKGGEVGGKDGMQKEEEGRVMMRKRERYTHHMEV